MSIAWDVGFRARPSLSDLDALMEKLGFSIEPRGQRQGDFTRVYLCEEEWSLRSELDGRPNPDLLVVDEKHLREIEFFYEERADSGSREHFGSRQDEIVSYGALKTFSSLPSILNPDERMRVIAEKGVRTQHDYYRHLEPERLKWYETALALRERFGAIVLSEQTGDEIDPNRPFPGRR